MNGGDVNEVEKLFHFISIGDLISLKKSLQNYVDANLIRLDNYTLLYAAVIVGQFEIVKYLVSIGCEVDSLNEIAPGDCFDTPFNIACLYGYIDIVKYLYSYGANANFKNQYGINGFVWGIFQGHLDIVKFFVSELNYNIDEPIEMAESPPLFIAIHQEHYNIFEYLVECGADINYHLSDGCTPFLFSIINSKIKYTKILALLGADIYETLNGKTPLFLAIVNNDFEMVKFLLKCGANFSGDFIEITHAIQNHYNEIAKLLISYTSCVIIPYIYSALSDAIDSKNIDIFKFLLENGMNYDQTKSLSHCLTYACLNNSIEIIKYLLENKCNMNNISVYINQNDFDEDDVFYEDLQGSEYHTMPFLIAVSSINCSPSLYDFILKNGADPNQFYIFTPLIYSLFIKNFENAKLLIKYGAVPSSCKLENIIFQIEGSSCFELIRFLVLSNFIKDMDFISTGVVRIDLNPRLLNFLIQNGIRYDRVFELNKYGSANYLIDIPETDEEVKSAIQIFEILSQLGIGYYDSSEYPLLIHYVNNFEIFKYLVEKGINIGCMKNGKNIIHYIAKEGTVEALKYALQFGIPFYKTDNQGQTPYDIAIKHKRYEMASILDTLEITVDKNNI